MHAEGTLTLWNHERGFGRIESTQNGEPVFVHVRAWSRSPGRPKLGQANSRSKVFFDVAVIARRTKLDGATLAAAIAATFARRQTSLPAE
ncbi:MAG TPA: cold shock domain-containing protein [Burkholderiaceae bacterium]|nr:cold shock domain-containing protein [Burkholderiaceae bacterium]